MGYKTRGHDRDHEKMCLFIRCRGKEIFYTFQKRIDYIATNYLKSHVSLYSNDIEKLYNIQ